MATGPQILHGGAQRQDLRWRTAAKSPLAGLSWYQVAPGDVCSAHVHTGKAETWLIVAGVGEARVGAEAFAVKPGDAIVTPPGTAHALHNTGSAPLVFVNIVSIANDDPVSTTELER